MAYDNRTVANADLFDKSSPSGAGLPDVIEDSALSWTVTYDSATVWRAENTYESQTLYWKFVRTGITSSTFQIYFSKDGITYDTYRTVVLSTALTYTGNVKIVSSISDTRAIFAFQTVSGGLYRNTVVYIGGIDAFDSNDVNSFGIWASDAPEQKGENLLAEGFPRDTRESMLMRCMETTAADAGNFAPFQFAPMIGWDGMEYGYNGLGGPTNLSAPSAAYTGNSLADIEREQKYLGNRMSRIGVYREHVNSHARGLRGTLDGLWAVHSEWFTDSVGNVIPKVDTADMLQATVNVATEGSVNFSAQSLWVVVPLTNAVKLNDALWVGPKIVAFPRN